MWTEKVKRDRPPSELSMSFPRSERQVTSGFVFQIKIFHSTFYHRALRSHNNWSGFNEEMEKLETGKIWSNLRDICFCFAVFFIVHHYFEEMWRTWWKTNILWESRKSVQRSCLSPCGQIKGEEKTFVWRIIYKPKICSRVHKQPERVGGRWASSEALINTQAK